MNGAHSSFRALPSNWWPITYDDPLLFKGLVKCYIRITDQTHARLLIL